MGVELVPRPEQNQKLSLTPELQRSLKILQYSSTELREYIQKEVEDNPLLELNEEGWHDDASFTGRYRQSVDWKSFFEDMEYGGSDTGGFLYRDSEEYFNYENLASYETTLQEYLHFQLKLQHVSSEDRRVAAFIIESLDENGYLTLSSEEIASMLRVDYRRVSRLLHLVQTFDPPGVGARNLRECLLIQLKRMGMLTSEVQAVVLGHLQDIADNNYQNIRKKLGISMKRVKQICELIRSLEPKPGKNFASSRYVKYIVPDVEVKKIGEDYEVIVREVAAPHLKVSECYKRMLKNSPADTSASAYLMLKLQSALQLIKAIERRKETLKNVITAIVRYQKDFLDHGILFLKPLTLRMISECTGLHESTISRAISGKYVQTPRGIFELKYFFSSGVSNRNGEKISSTSIKRMIKELLNEESSEYPLSDQKISEILKGKGIDISRRTVSKYREEMGIPNSKLRRHC